MKLKKYFLFLGFTLLSGLWQTNIMAQDYGRLNEKVTISLSHSDAAEVIRKLREQSTCNFLYDPSVLKEIQIDNMKFEGVNLGVVLEYLSRTANLYFSINNKTISVQKGRNGTGQQRLEITGKVVEGATGLPLQGATVKTSSGVSFQTDVNGFFRIAVNMNSLLTVSYTGLQTKAVKPDGQRTLTISLQSADASMNEVVVIGYGTQLKEKITGSVVTISGNEMQKSPVSTFTEAMVGKLPGVQVTQTTGVPGAAPSIRVRGTGSITAGNEPLYVVDGFPLGEASLSSFNMGDIESVSVLKDASATSIYGSRGSNGVIIITTRRGKSGKAKLSLSTYAGVQQITKKLDLLSPEEFVDFAIEARNNAWVYLGGKATDPNSVRSPLYQISPYLYNKDAWVLTDWQDEVFRTAPTSNHQLSLSGGSETVKYMLSGGYYHQDGTIKNSSFNRYSLRGNIDAQPFKGLRLSGTFNTTIVKSKLADDQGQFNEGILGTVINTPGIYGARNADGSYPSFAGFGYGVSEVVNPMTFINEDNRINDQNRTIANLTAELELIRGLTFKSMIGFDYNISRTNAYMNSYINDLPANPGQVRTLVPATGSYGSSSDFNWLSENTFNYNFNIGTQHSFETLLGFTAQKATSESVSLSAINFPNNLVPTLNAGQISGGRTLRSEWSLLSYLARVNYSSGDKYFATATVRRDGSSRFGMNKRWGLFPSLSVGWMLSNERFFHVPWINFLKVRASYGLAGNNDISNYGSIGLLAYSDYIIGGKRVSGISPSTLSNQNLSWEKSEQTDFGIDLGLLNNRINIVLDIYQRVSNDLLLDVPVPSLLGTTTSLQNIGKVRNNGIEIALNTRNLNGRFKWSTDLNFSVNRNKVLALGAAGDPIISSTSGDSHITEIGKSIGNFYGYIFDGVFNTTEEINSRPHQTADTPGDPIVRDVNGDGKISAADRTILGNYQPDFTYGIGNNFSYRNFDLSVMIQGVQGADIMNLGMRQSMSLTGRTNNLGIARERWRSADQPGNGKVFKAITDVRGVRRDASSFYMEDGSYLRIRNISVGYNFPASLISPLKLSSARLTFTTQNPFTFTNYSGYNPEVSSYHNALTPGVDYFNYPLAKTFTVGLNVTF